MKEIELFILNMLILKNATVFEISDGFNTEFHIEYFTKFVVMMFLFTSSLLLLISIQTSLLITIIVFQIVFLSSSLCLQIFLVLSLTALSCLISTSS